MEFSKLNTVDAWHQLLQNRRIDDLDQLLSEDVTFYSPVVHKPIQGKGITKQYLMAAFTVLVNPSFHYIRQVTGEQDAILEFEVEIDGLSINGVDMIKWDDTGRIIEFKVMIRPLKAINLIHEKMGELLRT